MVSGHDSGELQWNLGRNEVCRTRRFAMEQKCARQRQTEHNTDINEF